MLGKPQKCVGETMSIESSEKEYSPCRMQSTIETVSCPIAAAILAAAYLQFPVAEKYSIIEFHRRFILADNYTTSTRRDKDIGRVYSTYGHKKYSRFRLKREYFLQ